MCQLPSRVTAPRGEDRGSEGLAREWPPGPQTSVPPLSRAGSRKTACGCFAQSDSDPELRTQKTSSLVPGEKSKFQKKMKPSGCPEAHPYIFQQKPRMIEDTVLACPQVGFRGDPAPGTQPAPQPLLLRGPWRHRHVPARQGLPGQLSRLLMTVMGP